MAPERSTIANGNQLKNASNIISSTPTSLPFNPVGIHPGNPPPLPPRQSVQNYSGYNDYRQLGSNYYGGYGYGNQYRGYGGYGSFGYNPYSNFSSYNSYGGVGGHSGDVESRFSQFAEESTRSTFRVVETVLQTFSSMTMLLESTYFALTNSFRAILSVAENIGRLRSTLGQLFSTFALIRFMKWLYRKITGTAGFQDPNSADEELWERSLAKIGGEHANTSSFWSSILMFSVFFLIPYVIHKISSNIKQIQIKGKDPKEWYQCDEPVYVATVLYDFAAANNEELSIKTGQKIYLAPQSLQPKNLPGWCTATDNMNVGLIPHNYIKVVGQLKKRKENCENNASVNEQTHMDAGKSNEKNETLEVNEMHAKEF